MNAMRALVMLGAVVALGLVDAHLAFAERTGSRARRQERQQAQSRVDTTFAFNRDGVVDLTQTAGDIIVTASEQGEARVRAYTERGRVRWDFSASRISIDVEPVRGRVGDSRIELSVPAGVRVVARSRSGDVSVRGTRGAVDARSTSGDVIVSDATDRVILESVSGDVRASQLAGEVRAESVSGTIEARDVTGNVHAETTSGDVSLTGVASSSVYVETVSGEIEYEGNIDASGRYDFRTHSGDVRLEIPESSRAAFSVQTYSGALDTAFPLTLQPGQRTTGRPRRFEFTLGGGGARVTAESFSGDIVLTRRTRPDR
ncbi:MAG TPA: DUF4097 family beta strand repeat-containing protein [Gemmatimonadaceae bacterium]|jgi:DUF4097 and DUF4098 domain-containing protein YvlB|nr:DUF4097 family beta strand repeat-containing protein [Gemmatimonadaceae bacterium]